MYNQQQNYQNQNRANQTQFQPTGYVQSYYQGIGARSSNNQFTSFQNQGQYGQQSQFTSPEQFHLSNYQGNQPGHDSYKRSDSSQPSQSQFGIGAQNQAYNQTQYQAQNQQPQFTNPPLICDCPNWD